jgi:hypothetical protein
VQDDAWAQRSVWRDAEKSSLPGLDHRTVQALSSRYTDWTIPASKCNTQKLVYHDSAALLLWCAVLCCAVTVFPTSSDARSDKTHSTIKNDIPGDRAVEDVGLRPLPCWDLEFEFRRGQGCVFCGSCVLSGRGPCFRLVTRVCLNACDIQQPTKRRPKSNLRCCTMAKRTNRLV